MINGNGDFRVNPEEQLVDPCVHKDHNVVLEDISMEKTVLSIIEEQNSQNTEGAGDDKDEGAYEGGDEHDEILSLKRDFSDFDLQAFGADKDQMSSRHDDDVSQSNEVDGEDTTPQAGINNGHVSDPGLGQRSMFWGSPILKRSCSNIETKRDRRLITSPTKSYYSSDNAHDMWATLDSEATNGLPGSPVSVMTSSFSADRVMRKKSYSFPVLPSMNRKLCWKLFLSSHKNFHGPWISIQQRININDVSKKTAGYCSDVPGSSPCVGTRNKQKMEQPETMTQADLWVQCYAETSAVDKVNAWIHGLEDCQFVDGGNGAEEAAEEAFSYPTSFEVGETSRKKKSQTGQPTKEIIQGNNVFQALCSFSPVANLAGMGLKVIPAISAFSSLRSVNLSGNLIGKNQQPLPFYLSKNFLYDVSISSFIIVIDLFPLTAAYISSGMLPKSLHTLDLSRNQIATVDGLRELTRLRVLNLSYNKISRISYGKQYLALHLLCLTDFCSLYFYRKKR